MIWHYCILWYYCILFFSIQHIAAIQNKLFDLIWFWFDLQKSKNRHISAAVWPMLTKFGTVTQFDSFWAIWSLKVSKNLKIHDSGDHHMKKSKYRHISAMVGPITTKFGTLTHFDPLDHSVLKISPSNCTFWLVYAHDVCCSFQKPSLFRMTR